MNPFKLILVILCMSISTSLFADDSRDALVDAQVKAGESLNAEQGSTLEDGEGRVYEIKGKAMIIRSGNPAQSKLKVGDLIRQGDEIFTQKKSAVSIAFDYLKKNAVHIPESSRAIFKSIEPTDIQLEDGAVFNAVDGLPQGSTWKISTPVAVAAVRGTVYLVRYEMKTGEFYAATVDVPDDGRSSSIDIRQVKNEGEVNVPEGKQITLREGESPTPEMVQNLSPEAVKEVQQFFNFLKNYQAEIEGKGTIKSGESKYDYRKSDLTKYTPPSIEPEKLNKSLGDQNSSHLDDMTSSPLDDRLPRLDPSEDLKDQHGQKEIEEKMTGDHEYKMVGSV